MTNPDLLKEVKDSEPSFTAAADGAVWVVCGIVFSIAEL